MVAVRAPLPILGILVVLASFGVSFAHRHEVPAWKRELRARLEVIEVERRVLLERMDRIDRELEDAQKRLIAAHEELERQRAMEQLEQLRRQGATPSCRLPRLHIDDACKYNPLECR
jgi:hypothetical protein